jgi:hypothetical protein
MKDNEKNLNNALSDEAAESVAGGVWTEEQLKKLKHYCNYVKWADDEEGGRWTWRTVHDAKKYDSPADFIQNATDVDEDIIKFVKENLC